MLKLVLSDLNLLLVSKTLMQVLLEDGKQKSKKIE
jgi:hypothetical protein